RADRPRRVRDGDVAGRAGRGQRDRRPRGGPRRPGAGGAGPGGRPIDRAFRGSAPPRAGAGKAQVGDMSAWPADCYGAAAGEGTTPAREVPRVAHLASHRVQYYAPLYGELARREAIDLTVFFYSAASIAAYHDPGFGRTVRWDRELLDGYRARFCPSAARTPAGAGW